MIPVSGRIELRPQQGRGLNGRTLPPAGRPTNLGNGRLEAVKKQPTRDDLPLLARFWPKGSLSPLLWGRTASTPRYVDLRRPGSTVVIHFYFGSLKWSTSTVLHRGVINAAAHVAALLSPVLVAERAPRVLVGTPPADTPITLISTPLQ